MAAFIRAVLLSFVFALLTACAQPNPSTGDAIGNIPGSDGSSGQVDEPSKTPPEVDPDYTPEALSWETASRPERKSWSDALYALVKEKFTTLDKATDVEYFCPKYDSLITEQKINLWAGIISATTYYESGYNPKSYSVDVGTDDNKDTWSVGLLQLSVVDQKNYGFNYGYTFTDLQDPIKNLTLGMQIFARQISKYGIVMIPTGGKGLYWAVLHPGGKYDQSANIAAMTGKLSFCK